MSSAAHSVALMRLGVSSRELVFFEGEGHVRDLGSAGDLSRLLSSERKQRCSFRVASSAACAYIAQQCVALVSASFAFCSYSASSCRFISECFCFCSLYLEALVRRLQPRTIGRLICVVCVEIHVL